MKENPADSHPSVATAPSSGNHRAASYATVDLAHPVFDNRNDSSEEYDNDWDFGVGNLVIDLDADLARNRSNNNNSSPVKSGGKMSGVEHQATVVDKGLKMKIKRKNVGNKNAEAKHEIVKSDPKQGAGGNIPSADSSTLGANSPMDKGKHGAGAPEKDKPAKGGRGVNKKSKDRSNKAGGGGATEPLANGGAFCVPSGNSGGNNTSGSSSSTGTSSTVNIPPAAISGHVSVELDRISTLYNFKKETPAHDPYEFNAKVEDRPLGFPVKKIKVEKTETACSPIAPQMHDIGVETCNIGVVTDPDCLGPCEPGTSVTLEGIVWHETENGVLVVNVTWRGKTYVGTLLDATKHDWAPPRFGCDSPTSDLETRTPKGRGKRGRQATQTPLNDMSNYVDRKLRKSRRCNSGTFTAPPSPARSELSSVGGLKRKGRPLDLDLNNIDAPKASKRSRSNSRSTPTGNSDSPAFIECPEPNCNKKYRHINGLRYHQSHAHQNAGQAEEDGEEAKEMESEDNVPPSPNAKSDNSSGNTGSNGRGQSRGKKSSATAAEDESTLANDSDSTSPKKKGDNSNSSNSGATQDSCNKPSDTKGKKDCEKKAEKCNATPPASTASTDSKNANTPQVFQISGAQISCLSSAATVVSGSPVTSCVSASVVQAGAATTHIATGTTVTVPVAVTTTASIVAVQQDDKQKKVKGDKADKNRAKATTVTVARPIMPAPTPQMAVAHTTLATVAAHAQIPPISPTTSQLKPIQPKPTIMGEPSSINPALQGLKEKKPKKKKNKDKDKEPVAASVPQLQPVQTQKASPNSAPVNPSKEEQTVKSESTSVIKSTSSPLKPVVECGDRTAREMNKMPPELTKQVPLTVNKDSKVDSPNKVEHSRLARPPSSLSIHSPLQVATDSRDQTGEVQSPAYSDISDANESAPTLENEVQPKPKEEEKPTQSENKSGERPPEHSMAAAYGMYHPYYGQPPYLIPAVQQSSSQSSQSSSSRQSTPKPPEEGNTKEGESKSDSTPRKEVQGEPSQKKEKSTD